MNNRNIKPISPFILFCQKVIPLAFDESMSYYECLCALTNYLYNDVTPAVNNNADAVTELQTYVANYFKNLNVQEEINNKLDEMAESGQLAEIIAQYIQLNGVLAYDTLNDLKNADNVVNGSICKTLGNVTYNDGYGAFYKVRTITNNDVIDNINIIKINSDNTLIAELITNSNNGTLQNEINEINETITNLTGKKYVFMGDSYGDGYSPDGNVTSWITLLAQKMNLSNSDYISSHHGGYGFSINRADYNYILLLQNLASDNELTDMYVCGGYNDAGQTEVDITQGITNFYNLFKTKFPNAKLHLGFIGWSKNSDKLVDLIYTLNSYKKGCDINNIDLLTGCEFSLHNYFKYFSSDGIHPNQTGQNSIANSLYNCIKYGNAHIIENEELYMSNGDNIAFNNITFINTLNNGIVSIFMNNTNGNIGGIVFKDTITITGNDLVEIATITNGLIVGNTSSSINITVPCVVFSGTSYSHENINFVFKNGKFYVGSPHASAGDYTSLTVKAIQIQSFSGIFNALSC